MAECVKDGWLAGFEDGAKYGVKKIFNQASQAGIDLCVLDTKDFMGINELKRAKLNECERIFNNLGNSDKQEFLLQIFEEYQELSKKTKLKYVTIGSRNLLKLIN